MDMSVRFRSRLIDWVSFFNPSLHMFVFVYVGSVVSFITSLMDYGWLQMVWLEMVVVACYRLCNELLVQWTVMCWRATPFTILELWLWCFKIWIRLKIEEYQGFCLLCCRELMI
jgi:hypothetical protein